MTATAATAARMPGVHICRAEDGEVFETNATFHDIDSLGSLETFLHREIGIEEGAVLAYLPDGRRLETENLRDLDGVQCQIIFVFNQYYMDGDIGEVIKLLHVQPPLQPPIEESITTTPLRGPFELVASYHRVAQAHQQSISHTLECLRQQQCALRIASTALDLHLLNVTNVFNGVAAGARRELEKQAALIASVNTDIEMASRVPIHRDFMSPAAQKAMDAGGPGRTLGYYVSSERIRRVVDACQRAHGDLQERFHRAAWTLKRVVDGAAEVRLVRSNTKLLDEAERLDHYSREIHGRAPEAVPALDGPVAHVEAVLQELRQLDMSMRHNLTSITELKNAFTKQSLHALRQINTLNHDLVALPVDLFELQAQLRAKSLFPDIQRLHDMIYTYGATVIEVVRRKEFSRLFYRRYQSISEVMTNISAAENARRRAFRGEVQSQLPFDLMGMDNVINFSPAGGGDTGSPYTLERSDIKDLMGNLEDLERYAESLKDNDMALASIREVRTKLEGLVGKMDAFESSFDRFVGQPLLPSSRPTQSGRYSEQTFEEFAQNIRDLERRMADRETLRHEERRALEAEVDRLNEQLRIVGDERERAERLERELLQARTQTESETTARLILEDRYTNLLAIVKRQRQELGDALSEATGQTKTVDHPQRFAQDRGESEEIREAGMRNTAITAMLLEDQRASLRNPERALAQVRDMTTQIDIRIQTKPAPDASGHIRQLPDRITEADGGRVALKSAELRSEAEGEEHQRKEATIQVEANEADAAGLRADLQRVERELRDARHVQNVLREDVQAGRASQSELGHKLAKANQSVAQLLEISIAYRTTHFKALALARAAVSHPSARKEPEETYTLPPNDKRGTVAVPLDEPSPFVDPSNPAGAIKILRSVDHEGFLDVITKTASTTHKWQKQCKEYRERAKGKISFRNFSNGDRALFLPVRSDPTSWAAFNVSSPHHFLQMTGDLVEQLKTREWLVARITSITERVVEPNVPDSNPYGLSDGVRYYMLEVDEWKRLSPPKRSEKTSPVAAETGEDPVV
ncbi:autophagy-related protein 11-domain-containing protein [Lactifluus subvellereus]|nr:autophagy-related protein 11-domain-containing protein [Lactifluus subvellereus]